MKRTRIIIVGLALVALAGCAQIQGLIGNNPKIAADLQIAISVAEGLATAAPLAACAIMPPDCILVTGICAQAETYLKLASAALTANDTTTAAAQLAQAQNLLSNTAVKTSLKAAKAKAAAAKQ